MQVSVNAPLGGRNDVLRRRHGDTGVDGVAGVDGERIDDPAPRIDDRGNAIVSRT